MDIEKCQLLIRFLNVGNENLSTRLQNNTGDWNTKYLYISDMTKIIYLQVVDGDNLDQVLESLDEIGRIALAVYANEIKKKNNF